MSIVSDCAVDPSDASSSLFGADFQPLSRVHADALLSTQPASVSLWGLVLGQALVGLLLTLLVGALTWQLSATWSAAYGALAVVLPATLFARGLSRLRGLAAASRLQRFWLLEFVKIALTVLILLAAPRVLSPLVWWALLLSFVLTMKLSIVVLWVMMRWRSVRSARKNRSEIV